VKVTLYHRAPRLPASPPPYQFHPLVVLFFIYITFQNLKTKLKISISSVLIALQSYQHVYKYFYICDDVIRLSWQPLFIEHDLLLWEATYIPNFNFLAQTYPELLSKQDGCTSKNI